MGELMSKEMIERFFIELTDPDELGIGDSRVRSLCDTALAYWEVITARGEGTGVCTCHNYPHLPNCGEGERYIALQAENAELRRRLDAKEMSGEAADKVEELRRHAEALGGALQFLIKLDNGDETYWWKDVPTQARSVGQDVINSYETWKAAQG